MVRTDHLHKWFRFDASSQRPHHLDQIAPQSGQISHSFRSGWRLMLAAVNGQETTRGALLPGDPPGLHARQPGTWGLHADLLAASWLELGTGVFCCVIAGILLGAGWSKAYWSSAMERQVSAWRRIADAMFRWIEETPVPVDSLKTLQRSLDETIGS